MFAKVALRQMTGDGQKLEQKPVSPANTLQLTYQSIRHIPASMKNPPHNQGAIWESLQGKTEVKGVDHFQPKADRNGNTVGTNSK